MERRDRSLEALKEIQYITSLNDDFKRGEKLLEWGKEYLSSEDDFDLELDDLKKLSELIYMNMNFLKIHVSKAKTNVKDMHKIKKFFNHYS